MQQVVIGTFGSRNEAEVAVDELQAAGFDPNEISIVAKDERQGGGHEEGAGGAGEGVAWGSGVGGLAGLLASAGALAIPGIGPILAAGPIAATLSGAVTGGVAGGLLDFGIPEERGKHFEERIRQGDIVAAVRTDRTEDAIRIFNEHGAEDVEAHRKTEG